MNQMSIRSFLFNIAVLILILTRSIQTQSLKNKLLLSGQILQQDSSVKDIEPGSRVVVRLRSTSQNNDTSQTMISQQMWTVDKFPIPFEINYSLNSVRENQLYEVNVRILNRKNVISFVNGQITLVKLFGANRTINVNVPLISFPVSLRLSTAVEWPELVGIDGCEALKIIQNETGFEKVYVVTEKSKVSKDIRYDRVYIYINEVTGRVKYVPRVG